MSTTLEQLEGAALTLARSGTIKDRLADAYRNHLALVSTDALPDALRAEFRACHDGIDTRAAAAGRGCGTCHGAQDVQRTRRTRSACSVVRMFASWRTGAAPPAQPETRAARG